VLLAARKLVQRKLHDVEMNLRGILCDFGSKVGVTTPRSSHERVCDLVSGHSALKRTGFKPDAGVVSSVPP
jgi:transposase